MDPKLTIEKLEANFKKRLIEIEANFKEELQKMQKCIKKAIYQKMRQSIRKAGVQLALGSAAKLLTQPTQSKQPTQPTQPTQSKQPTQPTHPTKPKEDGHNWEKTSTKFQHRHRISPTKIPPIYPGFTCKDCNQKGLRCTQCNSMRIWTNVSRTGKDKLPQCTHCDSSTIGFIGRPLTFCLGCAGQVNPNTGLKTYTLYEYSNSNKKMERNCPIKHPKNEPQSLICIAQRTQQIFPSPFGGPTYLKPGDLLEVRLNSQEPWHLAKIQLPCKQGLPFIQLVNGGTVMKWKMSTGNWRFANACAASMLPNGTRVKIWWSTRHTWFEGKLHRQDKLGSTVTLIQYNDGSKKRYDLGVERWELVRVACTPTVSPRSWVHTKHPNGPTKRNSSCIEVGKCATVKRLRPEIIIPA